MGRRIEIELTSKRDDGTWTWRAPGARQPKGIIDGGLLPATASVGVVLKADAEFELEGIVITGVVAPKVASDAQRQERIEILGTSQPESGVSVTLARDQKRSRGAERGRDGAAGRAGGRSGAHGRSAGPAESRSEGARSGERRPRSPGFEGAGRYAGSGSRPDDRGGPDGPGRSANTGPSAKRPTRESAKRPGAASTRATGARATGARATGARDAGAGDNGRRGPRGRSLQVSTEFRNKALAELPSEQLPVAEQLLRGGIPAVRQAIEEQNAKARSEDRPEISADPLLRMAEQLLPKMNLAAWKDRSVAAKTAGKETPLRELRSIVASSSTVALDEEGRELMVFLRSELDGRVAALRDGWVTRISSALDDGRVVDALTTSTRLPEPAARVPAELAVRLSQCAGAAMTADLSESAWLTLLDAAVESPVRRTVKPAALPTGTGEELLAKARRAAGIVPELARLLGLPVPPPPGPRRPTPARRA